MEDSGIYENPQRRNLMKILENQTIYHCDFCSKTLRRKHDMVKHEQFCRNNPNNQHICSDCIFLKTQEIIIQKTGQYPENYYQITTNRFHCIKLIKNLYPYPAEKWIKKYSEQFKDSERMPLNCNMHKSSFINYVY